AVARAAIEVAGAAAQRHDGVYADTLTRALVSPDPELRRIGFTAVRALGERGRGLFKAALTRDPDSSARRELLVEVSVTSGDDAPSASNAVAVLSDQDAPPALRERAKDQIQAALTLDPAAAASSLIPLLANERAPQEARLYAIELLRDLD